MRKAKTAMVAMALMASTATSAQTAKAWQDNMIAKMEFGGGTKNKDVTPLSFDLQLGYKPLPRFGIFADYEVGWMLNGAAKAYGSTTNLGGGLSYRLCNEVELRAKMAASVGNVDLKQTVYDVNCLLRMTANKVSPYVSIGFRHVNSHTAGVDNYNGLYASFGFGL